MKKISANSVNFIKRRHLLGTAMAAAIIHTIAPPAVALTGDQATDLIRNITRDIFAEIDANRPESVKFQNLERIFIKYADVPRIAQQALGTPWRSASTAQKKAYVRAFSGYMSRYYGRRFEAFKGAKVDISKTRKASGGQLVDSSVHLKGQDPYNVQWLVIEGRGGIRMLNIYIEGVSVLSDVRIQIGAIFKKNKRDMDKFIAYLQTAG